MVGRYGDMALLGKNASNSCKPKPAKLSSLSLYMYMHTHIIHIYIYIYIYINMHTHASTYFRIHRCIHTCIRTYIRIYVCTCRHVATHRQTHGPPYLLRHRVLGSRWWFDSQPSVVCIGPNPLPGQSIRTPQHTSIPDGPPMSSFPAGTKVGIVADVDYRLSGSGLLLFFLLLLLSLLPLLLLQCNSTGKIK